MGNQGNKVHITFNRKLPVYTFNAPHNIDQTFDNKSQAYFNKYAMQ